MENESESSSEKKPFWPAQAPSTPPPLDVGTPPPAPQSSDLSEKVKPVVEGAKTAAVTAAKMAEQGARKAWPVIEPLLKRAWLNLRVWMPQLANPDFRARQVTYDSDEFLHDGVWHIEFPRQCWKTGVAENLTKRELEIGLRSSENPLQIVLGTVAAFAIFGLIWWFIMWTWGSFLLMLLVPLVGYGILHLKSWPEQVRLSYYSAGDVTEPMPLPEGVGFDGKLYLVLADAKLAEAGRMGIAAKRKARAGGPLSQMGVSTPSAGPAVDPTLAPRGDTPTSPSGYRREELPPLKLDE